MISGLWLNKINNYIASNLSKAVIKLDNIDTDINIHSTNIVNNVLTVYIFLNDSIQGHITYVKLIDLEGNIFAEKADNILKDVSDGILASFKFTLSEVI